MLRSVVDENADISSGVYDEMSNDVILLAPDLFVYKRLHDCFARMDKNHHGYEPQVTVATTR